MRNTIAAKMQWAQMEIQKTLFKCKKKNTQSLFYQEGGQAQAQVTQSDSGASLHANFPSSTAHGREQPALTRPALSRGWD